MRTVSAQAGMSINVTISSKILHIRLRVGRERPEYKPCDLALLRRNYIERQVDFRWADGLPLPRWPAAREVYVFYSEKQLFPLPIPF